MILTLGSFYRATGDVERISSFTELLTAPCTECPARSFEWCHEHCTAAATEFERMHGMIAAAETPCSVCFYDDRCVALHLNRKPVQRPFIVAMALYQQIARGESIQE